jgi:hypothetical protein
MREIKFRIRNLTESCVDHVWVDPDDILIRASDGHAFYFDALAGCLLEYDDAKNISIERFTGLLTADDRLPVFKGGIVSIHQFDCFGGDVIPSVEGTIEYNDEVAAFGIIANKDYTMKDMPAGEWFPLCNFYGLHEESFTIIGNIHENQ